MKWAVMAIASFPRNSFLRKPVGREGGVRSKVMPVHWSNQKMHTSNPIAIHTQHRRATHIPSKYHWYVSVCVCACVCASVCRSLCVSLHVCVCLCVYLCVHV